MSGLLSDLSGWVVLDLELCESFPALGDEGGGVALAWASTV